MPFKIRCPNPEHEDSYPSCVLYDKNAYCWSGCGYISPDQFKEWTGLDFYEQQREPVRNDNQSNASQEQDAQGLVNLWHRTLLEGPRKEREEWFRDRGFNQRSIHRFKFGHTGTHFSIPIWNTSGLVGYKLRRDERYCDPDGPKYINQKGMGVKVVRPNPTGSPTVIVEGELDAYLLSQWGCDSVSTTSGSGSLQTLLPIFKWVQSTVYICTDADTEGDKAAKVIQEALTNTSRRIELPYGDISNYLLELDPEERGQALRRLFR